MSCHVICRFPWTNRTSCMGVWSICLIKYVCWIIFEPDILQYSTCLIFCLIFLSLLIFSVSPLSLCPWRSHSPSFLPVLSSLTLQHTSSDNLVHLFLPSYINLWSLPFAPVHRLLQICRRLYWKEDSLRCCVCFSSFRSTLSIASWKDRSWAKHARKPSISTLTTLSEVWSNMGQTLVYV